MSKMNWMTDKMNSGKYEYRIQNCGKHYGTICMPTGDGKSGVMIEDIVYLIRNTDKNLIINLSSPILKLNQQLLKDLFEVIELLGLDTNEMRFFINSSDNGNNYTGLDKLELDANPLKDFENKSSRINIVASCHKSLYKFVKFLDKLENKDDFEIVNYLDEAHLLPLTKSNNDGDEGEVVEENERVDLDKLCIGSNKVYAFSATPDPLVTNTLLPYERTPMRGKKYAIHVLARESIQNGRILPPMVKYLRSDETELSVENLKWIMEDAKISNPKTYHKILVNCNGKEQLKNLTESLEKLKYKVFSICSAEGGYDDFEHANIDEFSSEVENFEGDCFVLHIKMLIAGIDIRGLTDCVIFSRDHGKQEFYRKVIQTIGRTLRCLPNERGKKFVVSNGNTYADSPRKKPYGGVYFISPSSDPSPESSIRGLVERYYGLECLTFERANTKDKSNNTKDWLTTSFTGSDKDEDGCNADPELNTLLMNVKNTMRERYGKILSMKRDNKLVYEAIKRECDNSLTIISGDYTTVEWLTDASITNYIYKKVPSLFKGIIGFNTETWEKIIN